MRENNQSVLQRWEDELPESTVYWMLIAIVAAHAWTIYLTYYNSRILGLILTAILNKFIKYGDIRLGSVSFSVLSGKVMFRDVHLITEDFSVRIQYGWLIFRWWRPYVYKDLSEDLSHSETRLSVFLDGLEFHVYNRSDTYYRLEKLFGLSLGIIPEMQETEAQTKAKIKVPDKNIHWRDLIPMIKMDINSGRLVFGNYLVPHSLLIKFEKADIMYTTKPASTLSDLFMHVVMCAAEGLRIMFVPSPKYNGLPDEPPRTMGEGFVILQSNSLDIYFYMDEPGLVPHEPEMLHMADGEVLVRRTYPCSGVDIKCGKNTDLSYGPWADRQREHLWKFFYPADYQPMVPTPEALPGEKRQYKTLEVKMTINAVSTIDILFTKNLITQAIHMNAGKGSYVEATIPWTVEDTGYTTKVKGQLMLIDATTSMSFRSLVECETFEFDVTAVYPRVWNAYQEWRVDFTACKAVIYLIYAHVEFLKDLMNDWSSKTVPDIYSFVPYTWTINLIVKQFEFVTLANQYNWMDTSSQHQENAHIAFCGELIDLCLTLPYNDFMPPTFPIQVVIKGETVDCRLYLPENNTVRHVVIAMSENMKIVDRDGNEMEKPFGFDKIKQWRNLTQRSAGWIDCWSTSYVSLTVTYTYHPMPSLPHDEIQFISVEGLLTPELEKSLLSPLRPEIKPECSKTQSVADHFDASEWDPDVISVELEVAPSALCLYGSLLRNLLHVKEDYFGEYQRVTDFVDSLSGVEEMENSFVHITDADEDSDDEPFDPRKYRPFAVTVSVTLHDIQAHLVKNCNKDDPPCPCIHVERLCFEMDKTFTNTRLQLLLSPCVLLAKDTLQRENEHDHLKEGYLALSGLQVRGHAMFSHQGLSLDSETLEYAWLIEAIIGTISGKLSCSQMQNLAEFIQTFIMLFENPENNFIRTVPHILCQHMLPQPQCHLSRDVSFPCPSAEDLKYRMIRVSLDLVSIFVVESGSALNISVRPLRIANCNLHGPTTRAGITGLVDHVTMKQYISCSQNRMDNKHVDTWLEAGGFALGPIMLEAAMALPNPQLHKLQDAFLKLHDKKLKRLWFLWPLEATAAVHSPAVVGKCGCHGGCQFFGMNKNGMLFFRSRRHRETSQVAIPQVCSADHDPGFGQSLLHEGKLVFELGQIGLRISPTKISPTQFSFTRGYMSDVASPDGNDVATVKLLMGNSSNSVTEVTSNETLQAPVTVKGAEEMIRLQESVSPRGMTMRPLSSHSDSMAYHMSMSGLNSSPRLFRPETVSLTGQHYLSGLGARQISHTSASSSIPSSPSGTRIEHRESVSSGRSLEEIQTRLSSKSSLSSPVSLLHSLHVGSRTMSSTVSLESDKYFSAEEDMISNSETEGHHSLDYVTMSSPDSVDLSTASDRKDLDKTLIPQEVKSAERSKNLNSKNKMLEFKENLPTKSDRGEAVSQKDKFTPSREKSSSNHVHLQDWVQDKDDEISSLSSSSTLSYTSAPSEQDPDLDDMPEDFNLVHLSTHMNQPITQSSLLLNCYMRHLSQYQCSDWASPGPAHFIYPLKKGMKSVQSEYSLSSASHSIYSNSSSWMPHFMKNKEGFSMSVMRQKDELKMPSPPLKGKSGTPKFTFNSSSMDEDEQKEDFEAFTVLSENVSKTTAVVQVSGALDVLVTPLLLESLQKYVEAVTPTLCKLHPSALIDGLHSQCLELLKQQNKLKKLAEDEEGISAAAHPTTAASKSQRQSSLEEEGAGLDVARTNSLQALFTLPRINICVIQASIVEEIIPFSCLEDVNDLTAVSLLAVCFDSIRCQLLANKHSCKMLLPPGGKEGLGPKLSNTPLPGSARSAQEFTQSADKDKDQPTEISREENVGTLGISRIHLQLRRLLKHSNFSEHILLTAIPDHCSSVLFTFCNDITSTVSSTPLAQPPISPRRRLSRQASKDWRNDPTLASIGFIMLECGLEDVSITAVRRLGYKDSEDAQMEQKLNGVEKILTDLQLSTREEIEQAESTSSPTDEPVPLSSPSGLQSTASLTSTWNSTDSIASDSSEQRRAKPSEPLKGDASTGILKMSTIWFHFAAPPPISIKKKVDFTRLDWNLLSTATPAINAWMNPSDRLMTSVRQLVRVLNMRTCSVIACMMTEALDVQGIHVSYKSKFNKLSSLSKTLQEDPSCQLLTVLRKYLHKVGTDPVERAVASETVPQLITLQKGILALMRQWKNVLYMPNLAEINFKSKKTVRPYTVTFSLPELENSEHFCLDDGEVTVENFDVVDEKMSLLQAEGGSVQKTSSNPSLNSKSRRHSLSTQGKGDNPVIDGASVESSVSFRNKRFGNLWSHLGPKSRSKGLLTAAGGNIDSPEHRPTHSFLTPATSGGLQRNDSNISFTSLESSSSFEQLVSPTPPHTPLRFAAGVLKPTSILKNRQQQHQEDLYQWMAKQQEGFRPMEVDMKCVGRGQHDSWIGLGSTWSQDDSRTDLNEDNCTMATSIMQLADAQILFKPFLQSLGLHVESVRPSAMMKNFGGHLMLQGHLDVLKIQIAESQPSHMHKGKGKGKSKRHQLNMNVGTPAFMCEGFEVDVSMKDVVDFGEPDQDQNMPAFPKFAMHKLEAKPTTLQINLLVESQSITQHVDMALLRLVHQVLTMVDNIKETQVELKERRSSVEWIRTHHKQESKDSTSSADTQLSDLSQAEHMAMEFLHTSGMKSNHGTKSNYGEDSNVSGENVSTKAQQAKISAHITSHASSLEGAKRPDVLPMGAGTKRVSQLRFGKEIKKGAAPKVDNTPAQLEVMTPPQSLNLSDSVTIDMADTSSPAVAEKTIIDEIKESTPKCWRHLYHLLELYATMPELKTVLRKPPVRKHLPVIEEEEADKEAFLRRESEKIAVTPDVDTKRSVGKVDLAAAEEFRLGEHPPLARTSLIKTRFKQSIYIGESIPLVVYGIAKIQKVQMLAELSGLKLEAELRKVHSSGTYKKKIKGYLHRKSSDSSFTAHVGHTMIMLLEGVPPDMQTVVTVNIGKSQALLTTVMRRDKEHNSALVSVGVIDVNIPQHPVVLHGMMTRSSRRLTTTLQEFRWPLSRTGKGQEVMNETNNAASHPQEKLTGTGKAAADLPVRKSCEKKKELGLHIHFKAILHGLTIGASILPSLKAQHKTGSITVSGITGKKARFSLMLPKHTLSFKSKVTTSGETTIPSSASIELPPIQVLADYRQAKSETSSNNQSAGVEEGLQLQEGGYLHAVAEVGMLEHSLTTDLLNHLVFVQKVFMKEVNEVVQKVSGSDQPLRLWSDEDKRNMDTKRDTLLYLFSIRLKGIQITATTPTSNAVRFETGEITLDLSNRIQMSSKDTGSEDEFEEARKMFVQAVVDLNLALGQLLKNPVFEEAEPEFHTMAFFKTTIRVRNAMQDEMVPQVSSDQEALLINLSRPIVLAQPMAFDKAVLVWLNYKNAYEYWTEQRMALNNEVQTATRQVIGKLPQFTPSAAQSFSTLFLQLTVDDMGICVPLNASPYQSQGPSTGRVAESEPGAALVLTVESTQISACSSGSLVSKGKFKGFAFRFADDFETSWDDWKPNSSTPNMNICTVPAGTYEVCSRTINKQVSDPMGNAKWILNVLWEMQGIDVHLDTNIGKQLSALGHTLTAIAGDLEETQLQDDEDGRDEDEWDCEVTDTEPEISSRRTSLVADMLPDIVFSHDLDPKERARHIEHQMNEQAKVVQDLKQLGASESTIEAEKRRLEELQNMVFHDFRRDVLNRIKRQSDRASVIRDKLGLGSRPAHTRSRSYGSRRKHSVEPHQVRSQTLDRPRHISATLLNPRSVPSRVQFGSTYHTSYTPPSPQDTCSMSFDEGDLMIMNNKDPLKKTWSLQDIMSSDSGSSYSSDTEAETVCASSTLNSASRLLEPKTENPHTPNTKSILEPNVDFELDVKVFIDNGKCILYPKEAKEEEFKRQQKRDRHVSGEVLTPMTKQKVKRIDSGPSVGASKKPQSQVETTVFFLPSVDVKVQYNSKTSFIETSSTSGSSIELGSRIFHTSAPSERVSDDIFTPLSSFAQTSDTFSEHCRSGLSRQLGFPREDSQKSFDSFLDGSETASVSGSSSKKALKKANLYALLSLQTLSEEMIISPCLLDFLEQALEPLPISPPTQHKKSAAVDVGSVLHLDLDASQASLGLPMGPAFFPVDVVVYIKVEPSSIRFNCQPISRVECLLQVPSLELVFSTKKSDMEGLSEGTPPTKPKRKRSSGGRDRHASGNQGGTRPRLGSTLSEAQGVNSTNSGGLSVTGCLSDFSLYIFHPYGGGQRKFFQSSPSYSGSQRPFLGSILEHGSNFMEMAGKDSLSLNVEFIRVNISRTRKMEVHLTADNANVSKLEPQVKSTVVRFSAICDIGKASFKYDMRRLSEILSLPKAWYRRNLARRLFLGDDSMTQAGGEDLDSSSSSSSVGIGEGRPLIMTQTSVSSPSINNLLPTKKPTHHRRASSGDKLKILLSPEFRNEIASRKGRTVSSTVQHSPIESSSRDSHRAVAQSSAGKSRSKHTSPDLQRHRNSLQLSIGLMSSWETLVLFAVNLSRLDVEVNMSNVMGHTVWKTREVKSTGRLSIDSVGHKNLKISAGLGGSSFDSRGGVVGGAIDLQDLSTYFQVSEDPGLGKDPDHRAGLTLSALEGRVDYMGSSVLMTRLSQLDLLLRDEWHVEKCTEEDMPVATTRSASLFVNGSLSWDQFHTMISRSTTPDIIKLVGKLDEFFTQQLTSSRRAFSAFGPIASGRRADRKISEDAVLAELRHHRHWQSALEHLTGCHFSMLPHMLPADGMILGGTFMLKGRSLILASFHGINFRSRYWAVFNIQHPDILFSTEAQKMQDEAIHIVQDLQFSVGQQKAGIPAVGEGQPVATISKVSRGHYAPQQFTSVREWFHYAFSSIEEKDIEAFPEIKRESCESPGEPRKSRKSQIYSHETEIVFALPALFMNLKSTHLQGKHEPQQEDPTKPVVECSFMTEFYDHIKVAMDAEVILFLHDLVSSYIKEKDKAGSRNSGRGNEKLAETERQRLIDPTTALKQDWREFHCKTWQMEPTVRLLHWASTQIEPVGADYVLQKLGFSHARVTIPKWMQRGFMDPLDKVLSVLVDRLIIMLRDQQKEEEVE